MPSETPPDEVFDVGLLSPVTVGHDGLVSDAAVLDALVTAEVALARAYGSLGIAPREAVAAIEEALGWTGSGAGCRGHGVSTSELAAAGVAGGNPVIPLVGLLKERVPTEAREWMHRGATSQDILDSALMFVARRAAQRVTDSLRDIEVGLRGFATDNRDLIAAARTLTQHAVPTTMGLRGANWLRGVRRATDRVEQVTADLPAQLGGAAGTLASFVELTGSPETAQRLVREFSASLGLAIPAAAWHTGRWPVTELGDALVQTIDGLGKIATDVATLSRTEIGELAEGSGGGSSAMPQKSNPVASVLIRSAALRAPQLGATLHLASAFAVDERPDGAWHAEWPVLRELLRLALGATAHASALIEGLAVDRDAVGRNVALSGGLIVSERLSIVLTPLIGRPRVATLVAEASSGGDLAALVRALPESDGLDVDALLDPANYTGLAGELVDDAVAEGTPRTEVGE